MSTTTKQLRIGSRQCHPCHTAQVIGDGRNAYVWIGLLHLDGSEAFVTHIDAVQMNALVRRWLKARKPKKRSRK